MKTKHEKIVEILKELIPPPSNWLGHPEDRIPTWESRLSRAATAIEQLEPEGECSHCDGTGYMAENLDKSELIKCEYCSPQQPSDSAGEEVDRIETDLLDAINSGLRKWDYKKKLSSEDALELLFCLQDRIMDVKLTRPPVSEGEIDKLWYKFAGEENDFGNLFLGRDAYDLLMDELLNR